MKIVISSANGDKLSLMFPKDLELKDYKKLFSLIDYPEYFHCIKYFCFIHCLINKKAIIYDDNNNTRFICDCFWFSNPSHLFVYDFEKVR